MGDDASCPHVFKSMLDTPYVIEFPSDIVRNRFRYQMRTGAPRPRREFVEFYLNRDRQSKSHHRFRHYFAKLS